MSQEVSLWLHQVTPVPDFSLTAVQLVHDKTGAEHLHIARKDTNNAFRQAHSIQIRRGTT